jgi:hypothetical protein
MLRMKMINLGQGFNKVSYLRDFLFEFNEPIESTSTTASGATSTTASGATSTTASGATSTTVSGATSTTASGATSTTSSAMPTLAPTEATVQTSTASGSDTEDIEYQQQILNRLAELYNGESELSQELKDAVKILPMNIRNNICRDYCSTISNTNSQFCSDTGCSTTGIGNEIDGVNSVTGSGNPETDLGYSSVSDPYSLLDMEGGSMSDYLSTGIYRNMFEQGELQNLGLPERKRASGKFSQTNIIQKDTEGVSNIFAPNIYILPKKDGSYASYVAQDPNDPSYRQFVNDLVNNYS